MRPFRSLAPGPGLTDLKGFPAITAKAADQLVGPDKAKYNPVYLWSRDAAAGRAVLAAAGRSFRMADARMAITSVSEFAEDFIRALSAGVAGAWRERWWTVDLLLVHGTEALTGTERAQDEFFHLFEALKRRGSRVMLVADRPPGEIDGIDERLRSRFEGGLVLEVEVKGMPAALGTIELLEPGAEPAAAPTPEDIWAGTAEASVSSQARPAPPTAGPVVAPSEEIVDEEHGGLALATEEGDGGRAGAAAAEPAVRGWMASPEKVVWNWPVLEDRLAEDYD